MPHPFFEVGRYPWTLPEARELHKVLYQTITLATDIDVIQQSCSADLLPLAHEAPHKMWQAALNQIAEAQLLKILGERLLEKPKLVLVHKAFQAAANVPDPVFAPIICRTRIFFDREPLRTKVNELGSSSGISVLLVRGDTKSGKTWTKHLVEDLADGSGDKSVYIASGLVATAQETLDRIFALLNGRVPKKLTTEDAWFRQACTEMMRLATKRSKERYWIIADDLSNLDPLIRQFFDQAVLEMQSRAFSSWFRLVLIDYPKDLMIPTKWKGFWSEDNPSDSDVNKDALSKFLMLWATYKKKVLGQEKAEEFATTIINKTATPDPQEQRPRLERINDELAALLKTL